MKRIILILVTALAFTSCSVKQEIPRSPCACEPLPSFQHKSNA